MKIKNIKLIFLYIAGLLPEDCLLNLCWEKRRKKRNLFIEGIFWT